MGQLVAGDHALPEALAKACSRELSNEMIGKERQTQLMQADPGFCTKWTVLSWEMRWLENMHRDPLRGFFFHDRTWCIKIIAPSAAQ